MSAATALIALVIGTLAVARAARLVTSDAYPPMQHLRVWWVSKHELRDYHHKNGKRRGYQWQYGWGPLLTCPFCFAPYAAAVDLAWAVAVPLDQWRDTWGAGWWWWIVNTWAAVSYLAAMVVVRDEPAAE